MAVLLRSNRSRSFFFPALCEKSDMWRNVGCDIEVCCFVFYSPDILPFFLKTAIDFKTGGAGRMFVFLSVGQCLAMFVFTCYGSIG